MSLTQHMPKEYQKPVVLVTGPGLPGAGPSRFYFDTLGECTLWLQQTAEEGSEHRVYFHGKAYNVYPYRNKVDIRSVQMDLFKTPFG